MTGICPTCAASFTRLLQDRIRAILAVAEEEGEESVAAAEAQCFHLMEVMAVLGGRKTSGVFDEHEGGV